VRILAAVTLACLGAVGLLIAAAPQRPPAPKPLVRVAVEHRTVTKRLPRRTKIRRVVVDVPRPAATPRPRPAAIAAAPARAAAPVAAAPRPAPRPAPQPVARPRPAPQAAAGDLPTDAASLHAWEEAHHRDAPNHDQLEHQGERDD
jgi:hypothetical protein